MVCFYLEVSSVICYFEYNRLLGDNLTSPPPEISSGNRIQSLLGKGRKKGRDGKGKREKKGKKKIEKKGKKEVKKLDNKFRLRHALEIY